MYAAAMSDQAAPTYRERVATTVDALMDYRGLDNGALARLLSVNIETVRRWRRGDTAPSAEDIGRLAVALNAPLELLLYPLATREAVFAAMVAYDAIRSRLLDA